MFEYWNATEREVIDYIKNALITQGRQSKDDEICKYRGPDSMKCAAGHLIPDEVYCSDMEGCTWEAIVEGDWFGPWPSDRDERAKHQETICAMQMIHDTYIKLADGNFTDYIRKSFFQEFGW